MKKFTLIGTGLLISGLAYVLPSSAGVSYIPSEYGQAQYGSIENTVCPENFVERALDAPTGNNPCYKPATRIRGFSDRKGPFKYRLSRVETVKTPASVRGRKVSGTTYSTDRSSYLWILQKRSAVRARLNIQKPTLEFEGALDLNNDEDEAILFNFELPSGFVQQTDGTYRNSETSLAFRIREISGDAREKYTCVGPTFDVCAINLGKEFRDSQNITLDSAVQKNSTWRQKLLNGRIAYIPVMTESFSGTNFGTENIYFTFTTLNPHNGTVVRIEAVALKRDADASAQTINTVFNSFRFLIPSS